jgi:hypothetical protein
MVYKKGERFMTTIVNVYFMENKEWYYFDYDEFKYKLTDKAPPKAQESYKEFYELLEEANTLETNE